MILLQDNFNPRQPAAGSDYRLRAVPIVRLEQAGNDRKHGDDQTDNHQPEL